MEILIANNFIKRLRGLMFKKNMKDNEALLLLNTGMVHTSFMRFNIGVHYLDNDFKIIDYELLKPWKIGKIVKNAKHIIETTEEVGFNDPMIIEAIEKLEVS